MIWHGSPVLSETVVDDLPHLTGEKLMAQAVKYDFLANQIAAEDWDAQRTKYRAKPEHARCVLFADSMITVRGLRDLHTKIQPDLRPVVERLAIIKELQIAYLTDPACGQDSKEATGTTGVDFISVFQQRQAIFRCMAAAHMAEQAGVNQRE